MTKHVEETTSVALANESATQFSKTDPLLPDSRPASGGAGEVEAQLVPTAAIKWLMGEAPDADGKWFGECEDATKLIAGRRPRYWWRSKFREMIGDKLVYDKERRTIVAASPSPPDSGVSEEIAQVIYEHDPFYESGEYVDGFQVSPGGKLSWTQVQEGYPDTAAYCRKLARAVLSRLANKGNVRMTAQEEEKVDGFAKGAVPLCGFCNAPWTEDMIEVYDIDATHGVDSYDFGPEDEKATVEITCSTCHRVIYRKEYGPE